MLNGTPAHSITFFLSLARVESAGDRGSRDSVVQGRWGLTCLRPMCSAHMQYPGMFTQGPKREQCALNTSVQMFAERNNSFSIMPYAVQLAPVMDGSRLTLRGVYSLLRTNIKSKRVDILLPTTIRSRLNRYIPRVHSILHESRKPKHITRGISDNYVPKYRRSQCLMIFFHSFIAPPDEITFQIRTAHRIFGWYSVYHGRNQPLVLSKMKVASRSD